MNLLPVGKEGDHGGRNVFASPVAMFFPHTIYRNRIYRFMGVLISSLQEMITDMIGGKTKKRDNPNKG
jgi:hypothetical protein